MIFLKIFFEHKFLAMQQQKTTKESFVFIFSKRDFTGTINKILLKIYLLCEKSVSFKNKKEKVF